MNDKLEEKLQEANRLRETEKYSESAKLFTECLIEQVDTLNYSGQIHSLCGHSLIYKILARKTSDQIYKNLTISLAKEALDILENHLDKIDEHSQSIAYSSYADALLMDGLLEDALTYFDRALSISPAAASEKGRLKTHIGMIKYLLGYKQNGINLINEGLRDIRSGDKSQYAIHVWETGALNALAKIYAIEKDTVKAKDFISESLKIAVDNNLSIRKREAEEIEKKISTGDTNFQI